MPQRRSRSPRRTEAGTGLVMFSVAVIFADLRGGDEGLGPSRESSSFALSSSTSGCLPAGARGRRAATRCGPERAPRCARSTPPSIPGKPAQTSLLPASILNRRSGGLVSWILGGGFLVRRRSGAGRGHGHIRETVIGLTIVALGNKSMPELVTSVVAGLKKQGDLAFGNIIGSNIYNILGIGGFTALIAPGSVPAEIVTFGPISSWSACRCCFCSWPGPGSAFRGGGRARRCSADMRSMSSSSGPEPGRAG